MTQQFVVHGIDARLDRVALPLAAESARAAAVAARGLGVEPTHIARDWLGELRLRATRRTFPAALFFRELALLTRAGLQ